MARITVEDCLDNLNNRFGLVHLTAKRVRQLRKGAEPLAVCKNKDIVVALREIAAGEVFQIENVDEEALIGSPPDLLEEEATQKNGFESPSPEVGEDIATPEEM